MQIQLTKLIEEMQQRAKTCETAAQDATQEALTGESNASEKRTQTAHEWMIRSKVWLEAEALAQEWLDGQPSGMSAGAHHH